jgi:HK97 family phage portal protein
MNLLARMGSSVRDWLGSWGSGDKALAALFGYGPSKAGVSITEDTALNISAVWACVRLIAGSMSTLPLIHYKRKGNGDRERYVESKLYRLLHDEPNAEMSSATFLETLQTHVLLWGNAFATITRDAAGRVLELYPVEPWRVSAVRPNGLGGELRYRIAQRDGGEAVLRTDQMLHVPGLSPNGVWGYSVINKARDSFGLTMAQEQFGASFFGKGSTFGGLLKPDRQLSKEQTNELIASLEKRHQGVDRAHQLIVLPHGVTYEQLGIPGRDAQFLQQRQFQTAEIARWFGVPPHMIGDLERSTSWGSGIAEQKTGFLEFTLRTWLVKWERELNRKLISPLERNLQMIEFNVDGLERGDIESRYRAYAVAIQWGIKTRNEVRALENLPKIEGGDTALVPSNMTTEEKVSAPEPKPVVQAPTAAADKDVDVDNDDAKERAEIREDLQHLIALGREAKARLEALPTPEPVDLGPVLQGLEGIRAAIPEPTKPVDFTPVLEAVAGIPPAPIVDLGPILDRVEAVRAEVLGAMPPPTQPTDLTPLLDSLAAIPTEMPPVDLTPVLERIESIPAAPITDLTPVLDRLEAVETERKAMQERIAAMAPVLQDLILGAARKEAKFEADRAKKNAESPEKLRAWMEAFYATREETALQHLLPTMRLHFHLTGRGEDAETETRQIIRSHVEQSRASLEVLLADPENLEANVRALAASWEAERPKAIADTCLREVIAQ